MKILIGYDGSKAADAALGDLIYAGLPKEAEVRIIQAVPPLLPLDSLAPTSEERLALPGCSLLMMDRNTPTLPSL